MLMKAIIRRGRTWGAVTKPRNYPAFQDIDNELAFNVAWQQNPDWVCAHMAHAAYHNKTYLQELFSGFNAQIKCYQSEADGHGVIMGRQAFMAIWPDKAILAFRGTEIDEQIAIDFNKQNKWLRWLRRKFPYFFKIPFIPADIVDDFNAIPITYREGHRTSTLHNGFYLATEELWPQIISDINQLKTRNIPLYVTGHSLGGAMALITAVKTDVEKVITFGMPAAGNNLANTIAPACQHIRYVNGNDPVTRIVPKRLFAHHGICKTIEDIDGRDMRYDHSIINYAAILKHHHNNRDEHC